MKTLSKTPAFLPCAESLASENARNLRQSGINEELFDEISGFEALSNEQRGSAARGFSYEVQCDMDGFYG